MVSVSEVSRPIGIARSRRSFLRRTLGRQEFWRGCVAIVVFLILWEIGSRSGEWFGYTLPYVGLLPPPSDVAVAWSKVLMKPPFEVLRPIPPLAWVPASLIFWPTNEMSIAFVTFLGAFFTIVINVLGGARTIDVRYLRAVQSMGASQWDLFWRIILPGTLPSIFTGAAVGMGITWEVVVAAEMISGGGTQGGGGLGFFIWNSYMGGSLPQIVVGMISIGIAGYLSSTVIRMIGRSAMPWRKLF